MTDVGGGNFRVFDPATERDFEDQAQPARPAALRDRLRQVDHVAYVRFASVYKQFRDLDDFLNEVRDVLESDTNSKDQGRLFRE